MPAPVVKAALPPPELRDRHEGWGMLGRVKEYSGYQDNGQWEQFDIHGNPLAYDTTDLHPSEVMHNRDYPLEHPETSDRCWCRVNRRIGEPYIVVDEDGERVEQYIHYDKACLHEEIVVDGEPVVVEYNVEIDYAVDEVNTGITTS